MVWIIFGGADIDLVLVGHDRLESSELVRSQVKVGFDAFLWDKSASVRNQKDRFIEVTL